ncbi:MAG TPA: peptide ABC transporter substrate-binding protein [Polyangiaceae bacterium]|nr:peptide ABC transporter substrate-binding protein [Polyangiaceae bacterium]
MDRTLLGIVASLGGALALVGFTFRSTVDGPADFRFANQTEVSSLDPQLLVGQPESRIAEAIFEGLTRYDPKTLSPAPAMAERWEVSPDGKRYTFHIRQAEWTDGHPVTAGDFVYSWKRLLDPATASEYAYLLFSLRGAEAFNSFDGLAEDLEGPIPRALAAFQKAHAGGADAKSFQALARKIHLSDALRRATAPALQNLLGRSTGSIEKDELDAFVAALAPEARRLREAAVHAKAHFGVDEGVFARDARTLEVDLAAPTPYFLSLTAYHTTMPSPRWVVEAPGRRDDWFLPEHIVTNGPFRLAKWIVNDHIRLERNEKYWGHADVALRTIDALSLENETTALNLYLSGALDWLPEQYPKDLASDIRKRPDFYGERGMVVYFYRLNTTRPPFDDRRVRLAVNLAVNRTLIVRDVLGLGQTEATTFVPPGMTGYTAPETAISYDVPRARALLAEAGYPDGRGFPSIGILYNTSAQHKQIAEEVASELRKNLGIEARAYNQEWQSFQTTIRALDYDMSRMGWIGDYADPNTFLDMWLTGGGNNQTGWSSPLYDRLLHTAADVSELETGDVSWLDSLAHPDAVRKSLDETRSATDPAVKLAARARTRMLLLGEAERVLVHDELPILPVYFYVVSGLVSPKVKGFYPRLVFEDGHTTPNLMDIHPLRDIRMEETR